MIKSPKLFYVEPNVLNAKLMTGILKMKGYELICFNSANDILEQIDDTFKGGFVEVAFNPICTNEREFYNSLREKGFDKPVFALTTNWNLCNICNKCGYDGFIEKPISLEVIYSVLFEYFPRKIFCIDDEKSQRELISLFAEKHLLVTDTYESVDDFCSNLEKNPEKMNDYLLGIVDLYMPGQFGNVLVNKLREKGYTLPLYLHTAEVNLEERTLVEMGFSGFLKKDGNIVHNLEAILRTEEIISRR